MWKYISRWSSHEGGVCLDSRSCSEQRKKGRELHIEGTGIEIYNYQIDTIALDRFTSLRKPRGLLYLSGRAKASGYPTERAANP